MNKSKIAIGSRVILGKILSIIGYAWGAFSIFGVGLFISERDISGILIFLIFLAFSVFAVIKGRQIKKQIIRFKQYVNLISHQHMTSIESLATNTYQSADFVKADLQTMINKNFFVNATINKMTNEIMIGGVSATLNAQEVATCSSCGASVTKPQGQSVACEYCGSKVT